MSLGPIVEVIKEGEIIRVPESQAVEEDLFILRKVIEPEPEPMPDISSFTERQPKEEGSQKNSSRLESWRAGKAPYKKNNVIKDLKDNFQWEISRSRRSKGISRAQLAQAIGVTEEDIRSIELGELPKDDFVLISKIEQHLGLTLRREEKQKGPLLADLQRMNENRVREEIEKIQHMNAPRDADAIAGNDIELID